MNSSLDDLLRQKGQTIQIGNHYRVLLHDPSHCFYVESGHLEIFFLKITSNTHQEPSAFLEHFSKQTIPFVGELLEGPLSFFKSTYSGHFAFSFSFQPESLFRVIAIAHENTQIFKIAHTELEKLSQQMPDLSEKINKDWQSWLQATSPLFTSYSLPHYDHTEFLTSPLAIKKGETFAIKGEIEKKHELFWIEVKKGSLALLGKQDLLIKTPHLFPLNPDIWLQSEDESIVIGKEHKELSLGTPYWDGIKLFQSYYFNLFEAFQKERLEQEETKAEHTQAVEETNLANSLSELSSIMGREEYFFVEEKHDLLYRTVQLVGKSLNLKFLPLDKRFEKLKFEEKLYNLCFNSHIFYREVSLVKGWWKHDAGPLLGMYGEPAHPVALIRSGNTYEMVDLQTKKSTPMDAKLDKELASTAYTFYRSFPQKDNITGFDLVKFITQGRMGKMALVLLFGSLSSFVLLYMPFAMSIIFNLIIPNSDAPLLWQVTLGMVLVALSSTVFNFAREYILMYIRGYFEHDLETGLWQRLFSLPLRFFRQFESGNLLMRVFAIRSIREKLTGMSIRWILNIIFALLYLIPMFIYSPPLSVAGISVVATGFFISLYFVFKSVQYNQKVFHYKALTNGKVIQLLSGISKIKITGSENLMFMLWEKLFYPIKRLEWKMEQLGNLSRVIDYLISNFSLLVIFVTAIQLLQSENSNLASQLNVGHFIAFMAAFGPFSSAIADFSLTILNVSDVWPLWRFGKVVMQGALETNITKSPPGSLNGDVRLDYVSFRYDKNSPYILNEISLDVKAGEFVGIVGPSGCGKSSLVKLLLGFELPEVGAIYYNGKDLASLDIRQIRNQLGIVLQAGTILDGNIRDNIVTSGFYTDEQVIEALNLAGFGEDLKRLPMGLNTILMEGGTSFSGGQRQRLLIARALISHPKVLIMDEATSALDNLTQELVSRNLERLKATRIVIAHRLSTIKNADRIYVLDQGKFVDQGTFKELASRKGLFAELVKMQHLEHLV